jgi:hypothetical protein
MAEEELGANAILAQILEKLGEPDKDVSPGTVGGNIDKLRISSAKLLRDIKAHNIKLLRAINRGNKTSETSAKATAKQTKGKNKSSSKDAATVKQSKKSDNALQTISDHLKDIKIFLKKQFKKEGLSGSDKPEKRQALAASIDKKDKKEKEENKTSSLPWLAMLFAGGALAGITKVFGLGAGGGVAGGLLAKLLPKIFKVGKAVFKRIPIIGSLFSFYEAYKHFTAGGIDHIIFGLLDVVAGIAYMVPGIGTAIGLGVDVLSYFLQNKANDFKEETGKTSFFGSLFDQVTTWLSETPPIKWLAKLGILAGALWADPSAETFMAFGEHLGGPILAFVEFIKNLDLIAGEALGLENNQGETVGLFEWIYNKVDEYIITPVKDFLTNLFDKIAETILSIQDTIKGWIVGMVDAIPMPNMVRNKIKSALGVEVIDEVQDKKDREGAYERTNKMASEQERAPESLGAYEKNYSEDDYLKRKAAQYNTTPEEYGSFLDYKADRLSQSLIPLSWKQWQDDRVKKVPEFEELPLLEETERKYLDKFKEGGTTTNTSVNTNVYNNINEPSPSAVFDPGFIYRFSRP